MQYCKSDGDYLKKKKSFMVKYPIPKLTILLAIVLSIISRDKFGAFLIYVFITLPIVLIYQAIVRWILKNKLTNLKRRLVMALPPLFAALYIFYSINFDLNGYRGALEIALAGELPKNIHDLVIKEDVWTDYELVAFFRCDPNNLREILSKKQFERKISTGKTFNNFDKNISFSKLKELPPNGNIITYVRSNITNGFCYIITDSLYSFAYIHYSVD